MISFVCEREGGGGSGAWGGERPVIGFGFGVVAHPPHYHVCPSDAQCFPLGTMDYIDPTNQPTDRPSQTHTRAPKQNETQIPVCAPYAALSPQCYKYRVKLTPGTGKKGKMAHAVSFMHILSCIVYLFMIVYILYSIYM